MMSDLSDPHQMSPEQRRRPPETPPVQSILVPRNQQCIRTGCNRLTVMSEGWFCGPCGQYMGGLTDNDPRR